MTLQDIEVSGLTNPELIAYVICFFLLGVFSVIALFFALMRMLIKMMIAGFKEETDNDRKHDREMREKQEETYLGITTRIEQNFVNTINTVQTEYARQRQLDNDAYAVRAEQLRITLSEGITKHFSAVITMLEGKRQDDMATTHRLMSDMGTSITAQTALFKTDLEGVVGRIERIENAVNENMTLLRQSLQAVEDAVKDMGVALSDNQELTSQMNAKFTIIESNLQEMNMRLQAVEHDSKILAQLKEEQNNDKP